jgi:hypothetical protein
MRETKRERYLRMETALSAIGAASVMVNIPSNAPRGPRRV